MSKEIASSPARYIPSGLSSGSGKRRNFSEADKRRIVGEACRPGASVSGVAKKYGLGRRLLFHWKQELVPETETTFLPVILTDEPDPLPDTSARTGMAPVIVERAAPGIEVELIGGRRVRFERDADPETVRRLVDLLEGERS
ncbi:MAG: IS66-like element accessory protein TnpA [Parvibaculaceae bacterium]